jgi:hypothetical protein
MNTIKLSVSLIKKYGKNDILSLTEVIPKGLFEPSWCREARCTKTAPAIANGNK